MISRMRSIARIGLLLLFTFFQFAAAHANSDVLRRTNDPAQWGIQTGDYSASRYSKLDEINVSNVGQLKVAWTFSTGTIRGHEGGPLVVGNTMFIHTPFPNNIYALDLNDDGKILWRYMPKQDSRTIGVMCCDTVNRGPAYVDGKLIIALADTSVVAIDAKSGKELWRVFDGDPRKGESNTATVLPVKDKVIVGISGSEFGTRGHVTAYEIETGKRLWRAFSTGPDREMLVDPETTTSLGKPIGKNSSLNSWNGDQWVLGGGTTWGWYSYDPALDLIYYGTANPGTWNSTQRAGPDGRRIDQKWTTSVFARNPDTGVARWVYQFTPFDEWDYDGTNEMILADVIFDGIKRRALVHFDRNGIAYTFDRATGELLVAEKFDSSVNWTSGVNLDRSSPEFGRPLRVDKYSPFHNGEDARTHGICPAILGAKNQSPASFSQSSGLFYVPTNHMCMDFEPFRVSYRLGQIYLGGAPSGYPGPGDGSMGSVIAWDAAKGKTVWVKPERFPVWSGVLTTAGGIACYGNIEGYFKCLDQKDGRELYKLKTSSSIVGNVMTYSHAGKQYIAVYSGLGGTAGVGLGAGLASPIPNTMVSHLTDYTNVGGTVFVFGLP